MPKTAMASPASAADEDLNTRKLMTTVTAKLSKVALASSIGVVFLAAAFIVLLPLKQSVPYVVQVNKTTGEVSVPANQTVSQFNPSWDNTAFFLRRWVGDMFSINQYLTVNIQDPRAQLFLRGENAITEYKAFRAQDQTFERLVADPSLVRDVNILSLTPIAGTKNGVVAQVAMTTRSKGQVQNVTKLITVYYIFLHSDDPATLQKNPIGLYITDFKLSDSTAAAPDTQP